MALQIGIVGLPNVGKSTLFNALTRTRAAQAANYPFCTIDPNTGIVEVPDPRLEKLSELISPEKTIPTTVEFVDIAGLVKGANEGEGLGNKFLSHIREVDAICHVVRMFEDGDVIHVDGSIDGKRDREVIEAELILADLQSIDKVIYKTQGAARTGDAKKKAELTLAEGVKSWLESGNTAFTFSRDEEADALMKSWHLLTNKPILYACNVSDAQLASFSPEETKTFLGLPSSAEVIPISAKLEEELCGLSAKEASELLTDLGIASAGLESLIRSAYTLLGYITFFTAGVKEVRAWTVTNGSTAPQAAGVIHTDFERGFIRAETIAYNDFVAAGSEQKAKEAGKLRTEGKDYIVKDGDIFHFRFNV